MLVSGLTRRRAITILAAASASGLAARRAQAIGDYEWQGMAMGAAARIIFCHVVRRDATAAVAAVLSEIERLEQALSLFRYDSELSRLNREGVLQHPSGTLRRALNLALAVADGTGGRFDPTVQALWEVHVDWFDRRPDAGLPPNIVLDSARVLTDWRKVDVAMDVIRLGRGQRLTLNGLGQGYVTDRVADILRSRGFSHILVDLGEQRALGPRHDGTPWLVERLDASTIPLHDGSLATSEGAGCVLGAQGAAHHLFDPRSGRSAHHWRRVTVHHRSAAVADAFSTALYVASAEEIGKVMKRIPDLTVWVTDGAGREIKWVSRSA